MNKIKVIWNAQEGTQISTYSEVTSFSCQCKSYQGLGSGEKSNAFLIEQFLRAV